MKKKLLLLLVTIVWAIIWLFVGMDIGMKDTGKCYPGQLNYCAGTCIPK